MTWWFHDFAGERDWNISFFYHSSIISRSRESALLFSWWRFEVSYEALNKTASFDGILERYHHWGGDLQISWSIVYSTHASITMQAHLIVAVPNGQVFRFLFYSLLYGEKHRSDVRSLFAIEVVFCSSHLDHTYCRNVMLVVARSGTLKHTPALSMWAASFFHDVIFNLHRVQKRYVTIVQSEQIMRPSSIWITRPRLKLRGSKHSLPHSHI